MEPEFQGALLSGDELAKELKGRKKRVIQETFPAKDSKALELLIKAKTLDGWRLVKQYKQSVRMEQDKPPAEQLEDELWTIMAKMEFPCISEGRQFKVLASKKYRQVDVFAKDDESAVFIECSQAEEPKKKRMTPLIEKMASMRQSASKSVRSYFKVRKLKIGWIIATRNIQWSREDLERAETERITVIRDHQIDSYFHHLADHLKGAARYQLLSLLFRGEDVSGLRFEVPATKAEMGGKTFYSFVMHPANLLKIAYVSHKAGTDIEDIKTYQRLVVKNRLKKIAKYVDSGGQFPTNIVVNIHSKKKLRFDSKQKVGELDVGTLYLPHKYACAWIIDGQHRLFGYAHSKRSLNKNDKSTFPVLAYENLSYSEEAQMFIDINHEQKSVPTNLLKEIYSNLHAEEKDFNKRIDALASKVVLALNDRMASPLEDRIATTGKKKTQQRCLTLVQVSEPLRRLGFFGKKQGEYELPGPFCDSQNETSKTLEKAIDCLLRLFDFIRKVAPHHWDLGNQSGGFLATNSGVRSIIGVLRKIIAHLELRHNLEYYLLEPSDFMPEVEKLFSPLIEHFRDAGEAEVLRFRSQTGGMAGITRIENQMMGIINTKDPTFFPPGLKEFLENQDEAGTKEAQELMDDISLLLSSHVRSKLQAQYGTEEKDWWKQGVPQKIREETAKLQERSEELKEKWQFLHLIDYRDIVISQWGVLGDDFTIEKQGDKKKKTSWLQKLNSIRNITHHPEKWPCTKQQVEFVRTIHSHVKKKMIPQHDNEHADSKPIG